LSTTNHNNASNNSFYYILKSCNVKNGTITLQDKTRIAIDWWYQSNLKQWKAGDRLKIYYDDYYNELRVENIESNSICWGNFNSISNYEAVINIYKLKNTTDDSNALSLKSGLNFQGPQDDGSPFAFWQNGDVIFIFHDTEENYMLWNRSLRFMMYRCTLISTES
jgi:hypothetical protein